MKQGVPWAMPQAARATHAPHRANLRCLGLSVGIAIALAGCTQPERTADATGEFTISLISDAGIFLLTDKRTGCEYIALGRGGIILRSDAYGNVTPNCAGEAAADDWLEWTTQLDLCRWRRGLPITANEDACTRELRAKFASGTSGSAQDAQRLDPKGAGPTREAGDAQPTGGEEQ